MDTKFYWLIEAWNTAGKQMRDYELVFWNNEKGWGDEASATRFNKSDLTCALPTSPDGRSSVYWTMRHADEHEVAQ